MSSDRVVGASGPGGNRLPHNTASESQNRPTVVVEKVRLRTFFQRRGRLAWAMVWFVPVTAMLVVLSMLQRDVQAQRAARRQADVLASAFQADFQRLGTFPLQMPEEAASDRTIAERYFFNFFYSSRLSTSGRVGVCCMRVPLRLFLAPRGRFLVVFNGRTFSSEWLTELEFKAQAALLGLPATDTP